MPDDDMPIDGFIPLDPSPDEDAWEAYLVFALERLDGRDANGLTVAEVVELETIVGTRLPYEVGLMLVLGVPDDERWFRWNDDPARQWQDWQNQLLDGIVFDVEYNDVWLPAWGRRAENADARRRLVSEHLAAAPPLLPLWGHRAIPLTPAIGEEVAEANPVLSIVQTDIIRYGRDVADWMHREFDVPLPMWPETPDRRFAFWSEFT